jgi:hypothetical protein
MNLRHATALALVGWYLMVPPIANTEAQWITESLVAPLSQWSSLQSFDTAKECEDEAAKVKRQVSTKNQGGPVPLIQRPFAFAQCVATDDPRLKEK